MPPLPKELNYLANLGKKYDLPFCLTNRQIEKIISKNSTAKRLAELKQVYERIRDSEHGLKIGVWLNETDEPDPDYPQAHSIFCLGILFEWLAQAGVEPFIERAVSFRVPPNLDWSKLPEELGYLIEPATEFGQYQFDSDRDELFSKMTEEQEEQLAALAERIRLDPHSHLINDWLKEYPPFEDGNDAARHLGTLFLIFDEMELKCHDPETELPTPDEVRKRWKTWKIVRLLDFAETTAKVLPSDEGLHLALAKFEEIDPSQWSMFFGVLQEFRNPRVIPWIESNAPILTAHFYADELAWPSTLGVLVALSEVTWPTLQRWLEQGSVFAYFALETLHFLWKHETSRLEKYQPRLLNPPQSGEFKQVVSASAKQVRKWCQWPDRHEKKRFDKKILGILDHAEESCRP